jgi:Tol biopolymer transport system component
MTLDTRARKAAQGIRRAVEVMELSTSTEEPRKVERFDRFRDRKQRNRRIGAFVVAAVLAIAAIVITTNVLEREHTRIPATPPSPNGRIVFGRFENDDSEYLSTMNPDGTDVRALSASVQGSNFGDTPVEGSCMSWAPDGSKILISSQAVPSGIGLATINPDGTGYSVLDTPTDTGVSFYGCGAFSPDGTRLVLDGSTGSRKSGIYTVRASDGGDLVRLTPQPGMHPSYSPDGTQVVFEAADPHLSYGSHGSGSEGYPPGSLLVMNADGTGLHRILPPAFFASAPVWSPDGRWLAFAGPHCMSFIVHPDGSGLQQIPLGSDAGLRCARDASWSPDGTRLVFVGVLSGSQGSELFTIREDGTDLEQITHTRSIGYQGPQWGTTTG